MTIRVTVWNEFLHERHMAEVAELYPAGIHEAIAAGIRSDELTVTTATLDEPEHGLTEERLAQTDVLLWWGHKAHHLVDDAIVERVQARVLEGMGLIVLHSGHMSKIFRKLMGTSCKLKWREAGEKERLWVVNPAHPIAAGIGQYFELEHEETYGEFFDIPEPEELVFASWFAGGELFRSGCTFYRGRGRIFYFRPGHETFPTYYNENVLKVIVNGIKWAAPVQTAELTFGNVKAMEDLG
ncbi:ThuA domain-containing protein [Paenibacillus thalictri]|nr:ThuA domain-containing protein [Paenibacillus thalictri]